MKTEREKRQYNEAVKIVKRRNKVSIHCIMDKMQVGYLTAATLINEMETMEIIGKPDDDGKREVLIVKN